ncbi:MAG: antibiotic ABC transporter ATP-binding protein [Acidobacteria bacterium]|nr:MAG: antibiotic ABC transporter ATP-binding protein [Acidobacteriota bacterium]
MEEEVLGKAYDGRLMRRLVRYLRRYRGAVFVSLLFLFAQSLAQVAGPLLTKLAIDRYLAKPDHPVTSPIDRWLASDTWAGLVQISALYLAALLVGFLCEFVQTYLMQRTGQLAMFDLRRELMEHLQRLDLAYYDRHPVGRLITRVTTDVDALNELWASGLVTILGDVLMLSFIVLTMLQLSPGMTALMLAVMPLVVLVTARFRSYVQQSYRRIRVAVARINAYLQEHVNGMAVLQLFNREERSRADFDRINRDHMEAFKDAIQAYGWFYPVVEFLGMLALALLLAYGSFRIRAGAISLGVLIAFFQYGLRFFRPIQDLSEKYNILQSAMAASERVFRLLDTSPSIASPADARPFPEGPLAIEFEHVWFAYKDEDWVLRDVSFRINPGETIAVVGHTGAGKTTLASLLLRFYDIQRGSIRVGGIAIRELALDDLRRHFGVVLQDPYLFTGTVDSNIRLGTQWIEEEAVEQAAGQVNLLEFVRELPEGFAQPVRERGNGFSTGQKQLISFARALAHNPRFLILDEATSSVDTETEFRVREALARLVEGRTSLIIAHRLSTIQRADRIFVMHKGKLRESGTHQELLALRGIYWTLYQLQYKDQEIANARTIHGSSELPDRKILVPGLSQQSPAGTMDLRDR